MNDIIDFSKFNNKQILVIQKSYYEDNLSIDKIMLFARSEFTAEHMNEIARGFAIYGLSIEQMKVIANPKLSPLQISLLIWGYDNGATIEQIRLCANPDFDYDQMEQLLLSFVRDCLSIKQVRIYADKSFSHTDMVLMRYVYQKQLTNDQIKYVISLIKSKQFNSHKLYKIIDGLSASLHINQVKIYAKPEFNEFQMNEILKGFVEDNLSEKQVLIYADKKFLWQEMYIARKLLSNNLPNNYVKDLLCNAKIYNDIVNMKVGVNFVNLDKKVEEYKKMFYSECICNTFKNLNVNNRKIKISTKNFKI